MTQLNDERALLTKVLSDAQYREHCPKLASFMARSRQLRSHASQLLDLQVDMGGVLLGLQRSQANLEREVRDQGDGHSDLLGDLQTAIAVCKRLTHVVKEIADGIAWRTLSYKRAAIVQLALKNPTGHLQLNGTAGEFAAAARHVQRSGDLVVINDLTNFLRYGDYTAVATDGSVGIAEVKSSKGSARSGRATRQRRKLGQVLEFLESGVRVTDEGVAALFLHRTRPRTHLQAVGDIIRQARARGSAHGRLSDCLAVDAWDMRMPFEEGRTPQLHNPFTQSRHASSHDSLTFFHTFPSNLAPYSIYPFPSEDCTDLMTGVLWLCTHFNYGNLVRCLRRRGLGVRFPTDSQMEAYNQSDPAEKRRQEDHVAVRLWRPGDDTGVAVGAAMLARLRYEFLDEECFADCAEEVLEEQTRGDILFPAFENEADLWD